MVKQTVDELVRSLKGIVAVEDGQVQVVDEAKLRGPALDELV